jgi:hypothetical protein
MLGLSSSSSSSSSGLALEGCLARSQEDKASNLQQILTFTFTFNANLMLIFFSYKFSLKHLDIVPV